MQWKPKGSCKADSPSDTQDIKTAGYMEHQDNVRDRKDRPSSQINEKIQDQSAWTVWDKVDTVRTAQTLIWRAAAVLRTHRGGSPPYWGCGPDVGTRGTCGTHRLGACQLSHHHSQVYHQEERHQAEHHPVLCSHQWCGGREEGWLLPTATSSVRQKRNKGHNHTDGRFQHQDWNGQHGIRGHHGDTWTGTDEWKWWALCRPVRPEPAGDRRQHLPTQAHP